MPFTASFLSSLDKLIMTYCIISLFQKSCIAGLWIISTGTTLYCYYLLKKCLLMYVRAGKFITPIFEATQSFVLHLSSTVLLLQCSDQIELENNRIFFYTFTSEFKKYWTKANILFASEFVKTLEVCELKTLGLDWNTFFDVIIDSLHVRFEFNFFVRLKDFFWVFLVYKFKLILSRYLNFHFSINFTNDLKPLSKNNLTTGKYFTTANSAVKLIICFSPPIICHYHRTSGIQVGSQLSVQ